MLSTTYAGGGLSYTQTFGYDALNRLTTSQEGTTWSQTNSYDRYGNRAIVGAALSFNASNNRITNSGYTYDAGGNLTNDSTQSFAYDAENKITKVDNVAAYVYDGEGQRVRKLVNENLRFIYDIGGNLIAEFDGASGALQKEYIYGASGLVATIEPTAVNANGTRYTTSDHLGSPRVVTSSSSAVFSRHDFKPFGEEIGAGIGARTTGMGYSAADGLRQKFSSKERDNETGLDFFEARYFASTQGRFTSTDPIIMAPERAFDPQQINLYAYTRNNPLRFIDPDGETINEPTGLSERDQQRYDDWKKKFRSTEEGGKMWDKYANDKNFTLNITLIDRGNDSRNASAEVKDFKFDDKGTFVGATMQLGNNLGSGGSQDSERYPVSATINSESAPYDAHTRAAAKIAHEFGHLHDFRGMGQTFYEQQSIINQITERHRTLSVRDYINDPVRQRLERQFESKFGITVGANSIRRDNNAERNAIPVIRQLAGKSITSRTRNAMNVLEERR